MATEAEWALYSALDSAVLPPIWDGVYEEMEQGNYLDTYAQTIALYDPLLYMYLRGIKVDAKVLEETKAQIGRAIDTLQNRLWKECGFQLNHNSPKQCQEFFYGLKGIKPYIHRGTGQITCDDKALARMAAKGIKEAHLIQRIRSLTKLKSTYLDVNLDGYSDRRLRCTWNLRGTTTGRLSSGKTIFDTGLGFQNLDPAFRRFMIADDDMMFFEWDKRQAEWIVTAYLSGDAGMLEIVESGENVHTATAHRMTGISKELIEEEYKLIGKKNDPDDIRQIREEHLPKLLGMGTKFLPRNMCAYQAGKKSNHALNYDEGYVRYSLENEIPQSEGKKHYEAYHEAYPGLKGNYYVDVQKQLSKNRTLENCFSRKRRFLDVWGHELFKSAYAFTPQSTVGDIINKSIIDVWNRRDQNFAGFELLTQVHDSITGQFPVGKWDKAASLITETVNSLNPTLTYNQREFQIATDLKVGLNMGDRSDENPRGMMALPITNNISEMADRLEHAYVSLSR